MKGTSNHITNYITARHRAHVLSRLLAAVSPHLEGRGYTLLRELFITHSLLVNVHIVDFGRWRAFP